MIRLLKRTSPDSLQEPSEAPLEIAVNFKNAELIGILRLKIC